MAAHLEALAREHVDVVVERVNADEDPERVQALGVRAVPTVIVFAGDQELGRRTGAQSRHGLADMFDAARAGRTPAPARVAPADRLLRLGAGAVLVALGWGIHQWILVAAGLVALFAGVHDRCPLWNHVVRPLARRLRGRGVP